MPISQHVLKSVLEYNNYSGIFTWRVRYSNMFLNCKDPDRYCNFWNIRFSNKTAGTIFKPKNSVVEYLTICITINGVSKIYRAHNLAWLYMTGHLPYQIDHIDHNGLNNSFLNLRYVSQLYNTRNQALDKRNKSGFTGVRFKSGGWEVCIVVNGKNIYGGRFVNMVDAISKRKRLNEKYGFHKNHGRKRDATVSIQVS